MPEALLPCPNPPISTGRRRQETRVMNPMMIARLVLGGVATKNVKMMVQQMWNLSSTTSSIRCQPTRRPSAAPPPFSLAAVAACDASPATCALRWPRWPPCAVARHRWGVCPAPPPPRQLHSSVHRQMAATPWKTSRYPRIAHFPPLPAPDYELLPFAFPMYCSPPVVPYMVMLHINKHAVYGIVFSMALYSHTKNTLTLVPPPFIKSHADVRSILRISFSSSDSCGAVTQ